MKINHDIIRKSSLRKTINRLKNEKSFIKYILNRVEWHYFPRLSLLKQYPIHIDIELTSHCQLKCPMCFRFHRPIKHQGNMSFETFKKIIDEISGKVYSIKFTGRGEPLLNKNFGKFIEYLKSKNFGEVAMITNGQLLNDEIMNLMVDVGMDRIAFSIDGLKEKYEQIRAPIKYEEIFEIVRKLYKLREKNGNKKPLIRIQGVESSIKMEKEFRRLWEPISDELLFLVYKDYSEDAKEKKQGNYPCPLLYQRMMIHWNGTVPMCINDEYEESILGNVLESSVKEIWKGDKFEKARNIHKKGLRDKAYKNCSHCTLHRVGHGRK